MCFSISECNSEAKYDVTCCFYPGRRHLAPGGRGSLVISLMRSKGENLSELSGEATNIAEAAFANISNSSNEYIFILCTPSTSRPETHSNPLAGPIRFMRRDTVIIPRNRYSISRIPSTIDQYFHRLGSTDRSGYLKLGSEELEVLSC